MTPNHTIIKALQYQEMSKESKPFLHLIQSFSPDASLTSTDALTHNIRTNQITAQIKQSYITHWQTQTQQQSKMQCYLSLKREYSMAEYLYTVSDCFSLLCCCAVCDCSSAFLLNLYLTFTLLFKVIIYNLIPTIFLVLSIKLI